MSPWIRDLRHSASLLLRDRLFTVVALLTLAITIGANIATFSVLSSVLLKPLPYPEPERLVTLYNTYPKVGVTKGANAVPDYFDRRAEKDLFESVALFDFDGANLGSSETAERIEKVRTTTELLPLVGALPVQGRNFREEELVPGNDRVAILSQELAVRLFSSGTAAVGKEVRLNGVNHLVVGVLPPGLRLIDEKVDVLVPFAFTDEEKSDDGRHSNFAFMLARLRSGTTIASAQRGIDALNVRLIEKAPQFKKILEDAGFRTAVVSLKEEMVGDVRRLLQLIQLGVALVLAIGCLNLANLMTIRAQGRLRELAVRFSLGAGRWAVLRHVWTESLMLALAGGALGLGLAHYGIKAFLAFAGEQLPRGSEVQLDGASVGFTLAMSVLTGLVFGALPAYQVLRSNLSDVFRQGGGRSGSASRSVQRTRAALVIAQVAIAFLLLVGSSLFLTSFRKALAVDPGFDAAGVLTARLELPSERYAEDAKAREFAQRLHTALAALPGVESVGLTDTVPMSGSNNASVITVEGYTPGPGENPPVPHYNTISAEYFEALRIPLVKGRSFNAQDQPDGTKVAIIDRNLAERYWKDGDPLGRRIRRGLSDGNPDREVTWYTIVGVAGNLRSNDLTEPDEIGTVYFPLSQSPRRSFAVALRTSVAPSSLLTAVRREVLRLDPELPLYQARTLQENVDRTLFRRKLPMVLLSVFASVALLLAAIGVYGVLSYVVEQRKREIGIRSALGESPQSLLERVLWQGSRLILVGLALGLAGALLGAKWVSSLLYGIDPTSLRLYGLVTVVLGVIGVIACFPPSVRAARIDPIVALREE